MYIYTFFTVRIGKDISLTIPDLWISTDAFTSYATFHLSVLGVNQRLWHASVISFNAISTVPTLISLINVEVGINVEGVQKLPNH